MKGWTKDLKMVRDEALIEFKSNLSENRPELSPAVTVSYATSAEDLSLIQYLTLKASLEGVITPGRIERDLKSDDPKIALRKTLVQGFEMGLEQCKNALLRGLLADCLRGSVIPGPKNQKIVVLPHEVAEDGVIYCTKNTIDMIAEGRK